MSDNEENLVERDYEGEERAKMMTEINKRFDEMELFLISKIEVVNSKIVAVDSELKSLRANLYDKFNPGWRGQLIDLNKNSIKDIQIWKERDQSQITTYQTPLDTNYRNLTLNQIDHYNSRYEFNTKKCQKGLFC